MDAFIAQGGGVEILEEPLAAAQQDRNDGQMQFVHQTGAQVLIDRAGPAAEPDVLPGGSGCGCSATVTYGHILKRMKKGELKRVLIVATGALLSPLSYQQGETIPCVAHAVALEMGGDGA